MGADKGVHVNDDAIHGSDAVATSLVLAEAIKKIGERRPGRSPAWPPPTASMGVVPAMLAERLGLPQVTFASELTVERRHGHDPPRRRHRDRDHRRPRCRPWCR